jgi:MFS family permease
MLFPAPVMVLFWQENGLSLTQVMVLQALFALGVVVLEIPSGYFADVFGRKRALVFAGGAYFMAIVIYSAGHNFGQFLIAEMFFAVAVSLVSGVDSALLYDTLQATQESHRYQEVYGKVAFYNLLGIAFASVAGGVLATINYRATFYATLPFYLVLAPLAAFLREPPRQKLRIEQGYLPALGKIINYALRENVRLRWIIIYAGIILGLNNAALWLYQPYFKLSGLELGYFGLAFASFQVVAAFSSKTAYRVERFLGARYSLALLTVMVGASYLLMGHCIFVLSFSFAFLHQFVRGFASVVITDYVNQLTESVQRATVLSVQSLMMRLCYALIIPGVGKLADAGSVILALKVLGIVTLLAGGGLLAILHKKRVL